MNTQGIEMMQSKGMLTPDYDGIYHGSDVKFQYRYKYLKKVNGVIENFQSEWTDQPAHIFTRRNDCSIVFTDRREVK